jgi:hypothetical protein
MLKKTAPRSVTLAIFSALAGVLVSAPLASAGNVAGTDCPAFPDNSWWHADVSSLPLHAKSAQWMSHMSPGVNLHPDFGPSFGAQKVPYGIPITIVDDTHPKVKVKFRYAHDSDDVRYPLGNDTLVEGGQYRNGDRHTVVVNKDSCRLYETWATARDGNKWLAGSGATWSLTSNKLRPDGFTSADAAGFPILPGLLTVDEVIAGNVDHAIRFTTEDTDSSHIWPARHDASDINNASFPPMGARFRLKASYVIAPTLRRDTKVILAAMKKYGLALADNGSFWYFQGTSDTRWRNATLDELKKVPASAFEAVDVSGLMISPDSMKVRKQP